jgi:uncharacterized protein (TIGR03435 family)
MRMFSGLALAACATASMLAQPAIPKVQFEVASVRRSPLDRPSGGVRIDGSQVHIGSLPFREYVARAYRVRLAQVNGPDWIGSERFDLDAKLPAGANVSQLPDMLQALLADRFGLKLHREQKELPVFALVVGKPPLKMKESAPVPEGTAKAEAPVDVAVASGATAISVDLGRGASYSFAYSGRFDGHRMTAELIASTLERFSDRPVLNGTDLHGVYDFVLDLASEDAQVVGLQAAVNAGVPLPPQALRVLDGGGQPLVGAVEQLGLRLESRKAPVDIVIIDEARRTPTDN